MEVIQSEIPGLLILQPKVFKDDRGYFLESFNEKKFTSLTGLAVTFCQDNESLSNKGTLRGLHFQKPPFSQGKLVRVTKGRVLDVAVDIRKKSPFYGHYHMIELSEENKTQFLIPAGFAHGFLALEDNTIFNYKCTNYYAPEYEERIKWNDVTLGIKWPDISPFVSEKDKKGKDFVNFVSEFE